MVGTSATRPGQDARSLHIATTVSQVSKSLPPGSHDRF